MNNKTTHKRAVIFMRAREIGAFGLRDRMVERAMIEYQRTQCQEAANRLDAVGVREYEEYGGTGRLDHRPKLRLMLDELHALRDADYVIVASIDRLTRMHADFNQVEFELEIAGAQLIIADRINAPKEVTV